MASAWSYSIEAHTIRTRNRNHKTAVFAVTIFPGAFSAAKARSDMYCTELLKINAQLDPAPLRMEKA
jgi:hypothetical protein